MDIAVELIEETINSTAISISFIKNGLGSSFNFDERYGYRGGID